MSGLETLRKASDLLTPERVVTALDGALSSWRDPRSSIREDLRLQHPVFSAEILDLGCDLGLRQWTASALALLRSREVREPCRVPRVTAVWLAGSIPIATLAALIPPLLAGSAVYAKPSSADPVSARLFRESLMRADEEVGRSLAIGEDERVLAQADAVVVHGRDETLAELRARVPIDRIFVGYGHRLSVAAIGPETEIREAARAAALDVALYDGRGCLSPAFVLVQDRPSGRASAFSRALAEELDLLASSHPRRRADPGEEAWVHELRARAAVREGTELLTPGRRTAWTVILEPRGTRPPPGMLRSVPVIPISGVEELAAWCDGLAPHLSSIGQRGWGSETQRLPHVAARAGGSRVCALGRMQCPPIDWHHDGAGPVAALVRTIDVEVGA